MKNFKTVELEAGLYLVATPIGNIRDITLRALDVLSGVDLVLCEDTRVTGQLFQKYDITTKKNSYNDHNAPVRRKQALELLANHGRIALISDAGMPLISDPGYKLVLECLDLGFMVTAVPGANAPLSALQLSGLPCDKFSFIGFLPAKQVARKKTLSQWKNILGTLILFETGPRLRASLVDMLEVLGDRNISIVREITKKFEEIKRGKISSLISEYETAGPPKGEIVVVVEASVEVEIDKETLEEMVTKALKTMSVKDAANYISESAGISRKKVYEVALKLARP